MNSLIIKAKRFLSNKKTVTLICVIAGCLVLIIGYNYRVEKAISPQTVPYAKTTLEARHVITEDDIGYVEINGTVINKANGTTTTIYTSASSIIGMEVTYGNSIPAGSLFYVEDITDPSLSPDYVLNDIPDGYTAFSLSVDQFSTYNNYITVGSYIDLWFKDEDDYGKNIIARLVSSIKVLDVRDSKGVSKNNPSYSGEPAELLFAVEDSMYTLLVKATEIGALEAHVKGSNYTLNPGETKVTSEYVENYILEKCATIPDESTSTTTSSTTEEDTDE